MKPSLCLIPILAYCLSGCQRYAAAPLDLSADYSRLALRNPDTPEVAAYARALAERHRRGSESRYDASDGLSLEEAQVVALYYNPALRAARLKAAVPRAAARHAGDWDDPEIAVDVERILQSVQDPWVVGGMLNFTLPLSGRLRLQKDKALAEADVEKLRALAEERRVLAELRERWVERSALLERVELVSRHVAALEGVSETAERLRQAGELSPVDARLLRMERVAQVGKLATLKAQVQSEELSIKSLMGLAPTVGLTLVASLSVTAPADAGGWPPALEDHPEARVAAAEYQLAERGLALEIGKSRPDLRLGGGMGSDEGDTRALLGIALPLPVFNANRQTIAQAYATRQAARAAAQVVYEELMSRAAQARAKLQAAQSRVDFVEKELAPLADQQVEDARKLGRLGDAATLILLDALNAAHEARLEVLDARRELSLARARLGALLEAVDPDRPQPPVNQP